MRRCRAAAAPDARAERPGDGDPRRRRVAVDGVEGREAVADRRRDGRGEGVPRQGACSATGRADRVRGRSRGRGAADDGPSPGA